MSTKKKTTTKYNQTSTAAPPSYTAPGLAQTAGMVTAGLNDIPTEHYLGQQVAYMSPTELAAIQSAWQNTAGLAGGYADWMGQQLPTLTQPWDWQSQLPTQSFDMGQLADVEPVIQASLNPVYRQLTEQILPGIKSSALDAGAYTSDRAMGVLPTTALQNYSREAADIATMIGYENYRDYENRRLNAWASDQDRMLGAYSAETQRGLGQQDVNLNSLSAIADYINQTLHTSASVGDLLQMSSMLGVQNQQAMFDDAIAQDQYASYAPFLGLDQAAALLAQLSGNYGTTTSAGKETTTSKSSGFGEILKGTIGLGGTIAGIPGVFGGGATAAMSPLSASQIFSNPFAPLTGTGSSLPGPVQY